jgi:hypothetical protein
VLAPSTSMPVPLAVIAVSSTPTPLAIAADNSGLANEPDGSAAGQSPTPMLWTAFTPVAPIVSAPANATSPPIPPPRAAGRRVGSPTTRPRPPTSTPRASIPRAKLMVPRAETPGPAPTAGSTIATATPLAPTPLLPTYTPAPLPPTLTPKPADTTLPSISTATNTPKATVTPTLARQTTRSATPTVEPDDE